jgi:hypothetical protein
VLHGFRERTRAGELARDLDRLVGLDPDVVVGQRHLGLGDETGGPEMLAQRLGMAEVSLARVWIAYSPIHFKSRWRAAFPSRGAGLFRAVFLTYQTLPVCVGNIRWVSTRSYGNFVIGQWVTACHRRVDMSAARLASLYS